MKFSTSKVIKIGLIYGFICGFSNLCGVLVPTLLQTPDIRSPYMDEWISFINDYSRIINPLEYMTYVVPAVLCFVYPLFNKKSRERKMINLPLSFAVIGISGWLIYLLEEIVMLPVAVHLGYEINIRTVFISSLMYIILEATCSFTLAFFLMEFCHKKFFFPKYYPKGDFHNIPGLKHPSVKFIFLVNYISVTFFPVFFVFVAFSSILNRYDIELSSSIFMMLAVISAAGIIISISFASSIQRPIDMLKSRIKKLQDGDLDSSVIILSNDDFGEISEIFNDMTVTISERNKKIAEIQNSVIESMAIAVEGKDSNTGGHIKRTSKCVRVFVERLKKEDVYNKIPESFYNAVIVAAPMHDLGKLYIDDRVLKKNGKFTDEEYEEMKKHSSEGAKVVEDILKKHNDEELKKIAKNVAHYHHEKWNGTGYPDKLQGTEIPLEARIMALADVFDALVSKRCYKESFGYDKSFEIIRESLGSHFDPELGEIFLKCRPELEQLYSKI